MIYNYYIIMTNLSEKLFKDNTLTFLQTSVFFKINNKNIYLRNYPEATHKYSGCPLVPHFEDNLLICMYRPTFYHWRRLTERATCHAGLLVMPKRTLHIHRLQCVFLQEGHFTLVYFIGRYFPRSLQEEKEEF